MKTLLKSFTSLVVMLFLNVAINAQPTDYVNYYPFNGNANDGKNISFNGTLTGCSPTTDRNGNASSAIAMNGTSDYVTLPQLTTMTSTTYSFSFWFKANNVSTTQYLYSSQVTGSNNFLFCSITGGKISVTGMNQQCPQGFTNPVSIGINEWHYVAITITNSTTVNLYVDGTKASYPYFNTLPTFSIYSNNMVGRSNIQAVNAIGYFNGVIDEMMFFNRVLTDGEIAQALPTWIRKGLNIYYNGGMVGIGTANPTSPLTVNGKIECEEIEVKNVAADFVFEKDYKLRPLQEVESFIIQNGHLPDVPSANITQKGVKLGDFNEKLLQKVEELTLYMIEQSKKIEILQQENAEMKKKLNELK